MEDPADPALLFLSYSGADADWRQRFETMLTPVVRQRQLKVWSDERLLVGERWRPELERAIADARVALVLVSPEFLASEFIMDKELPALEQNGVKLLCVLVQPCLFKHTPLWDLQWVHDPDDDGPIALAADPGGLIVRICERVLDVVRDLPDVSAPVRVSESRGESVPALDRSPDPGALDGVPAPPSAYVVRDEIARVRAALLRAGDGSVAITGNVRELGLQGDGGIGKTVLAAALARDDEVRSHFPDGIYWVTVGERGDLVAAQLDLLRRLGADHPELRSSSQGLNLLRDALADRRCLLVVDDVWSRAAAEAFRAAGPAGRVLYTTRDASVLPAGAGVERIDVLSEENARQLLASVAGVPVTTLPAAADRVLRSTGRATLALALVGAAVGPGGRGWEAVADQLEDHDRTFLRHPYANAFKAMRVAMSTLADDLADTYRSLAAYPEDTVVPVAAVARLWGTEDTQSRLETLAARKLLILEPEGFHFHDLQRDFLLLDAGDLTLVHADLLRAYRALLPPGAPWSDLPHDEPYIWEHLVFHLRGAGEAASILETVADLAFIAVRTYRGGPHQTLNDVETAAALPDHGPAIEWLELMIRQWGHVLAGHDSVADLAVTLSSRIIDPPPGLQPLKHLLPPTHLSPRWGMPSASRSLVRVLEGHTATVNAVAFSPDGRRLASAGKDATVRLWDVSSGRQIAALQGHTNEVNTVAFAPDGRQLASAGDDGTVRVWTSDDGLLLRTLEPDQGLLSALAYTPDGESLACGSINGDVIRWVAATGEPSVSSGSRHGWVMALAYSPDGRWSAAGGYDHAIRLRDRGGRILSTLDAHTDWVSALAFSPDSRRLVSASKDGTIRFWDTASGQLTATLGGSQPARWVTTVAFAPDGRHVASASYDGKVRLWDVTTGELSAIHEGHLQGVMTVAFAPDGSWIASAGHDGTVRLWDATVLDAPRGLEGHVEGISGLAVVGDDALASASSDGTLRLWETASGRVTTVLTGHDSEIRALTCTPAGDRMAAGFEDGSVRVWDALTGHGIATFGGGTGTASNVAVSSDGRLVAGDADDGIVRVWDTASGLLVATLGGHSMLVTDVALSPDARLLASADLDGKVRVWDVARERLTAALDVDGMSPRTPVHHRDGPGATAVAFSPRLPLLASGSDGGVVQLWDPATGRRTASLAGHTGWVDALQFASDGRRLVSASRDASVCVWDVVLGERVAQLSGHTAEVRAVAFSPDESWLATACADGSLRVWSAFDWALVSRLRVGGPLSHVVWGPQGITASANTHVVHFDVVTPGG